MTRFGWHAGVHVILCAYLCLLSSLLYARFPFSWLARIKPVVLGAVIVGLVLPDSAVVSYQILHEDPDKGLGMSLWDSVAQRNPIRLALLDRSWTWFSERERDLEAANRQFSLGGRARREASWRA